MKSQYIALFILFFNNFIFSQVEDSSYYYHDKREFKKNIDFLNRRITENKYKKDELIYKAIDYANLGCAYSLIKDYSNSIEAIKQSLIIDTTNNVVYREADYYYISQTKEWETLLLDYKKKHRLHLEDELFLKLSKVAINDQAFYAEINFYNQESNSDKARVKELWRLKDSLNKLNLKIIEYYLSKKINVLSVKRVGEAFASACFLVIQHADIETQKKYLPIIKNLQVKKETSGENYALLYDRVKIETSSGKQYYGTQVNPITNTVYPIIDEKNVDKRRAELGMEPLKNYLELFEINYEPKK
jgi:hypothetical protein